MAVYKNAGPGGVEYYLIDLTWKDPTGKKRRIRRNSPVQTRRGAEQYEREIRNSLQAGTFETVTNATVKELADRYVTDHLSQLRPSTQQSQGHSLRLWILPHFGSIQLADLNPKHVVEFQKWLLSKVETSTAIRHLLVFRTLLNKGVQWGLTKSVPKVPLPKVSQKKPRFFSFEEVDRIAEVAQLCRYGDMAVFACRTGLRVGELMALKWEDISLDRKIVTVSRSVFWDERQKPHDGGTKGGLIRAVPLSEQAFAIVDALPHREGFVFKNPDGSRIRKNQVNRALHRLLKRAGLEKTGWHCCRHSFASHLAIRGVPLLAIKELLGHANVKTTLIYSHLSPSALVSAVSLLP